MVYRERALHNYFRPCLRNQSGLHNQCGIHAVHSRTVGCNAINLTTAFLYSDGLCFLWHLVKSCRILTEMVTNVQQWQLNVTCDHVRKERLIQLLDYLSVASPESGLFSDWSRNKRYLKLSHDWLPVKEILQADEFHHSIWLGERRERLFSALNASLEGFVHRWTNRMYSLIRMTWERCFGHATDRIRQEHYISFNSKSVVSYGL